MYRFIQNEDIECHIIDKKNLHFVEWYEETIYMMNIDLRDGIYYFTYIYYCDSIGIVTQSTYWVVCFIPNICG